MNLRNRFNQFFNKSKPADAAPDAAEAEAAAEQPASPDAPDWDILREETAEPEITYDDLARLVRFPGATPDASKPVAEATEFESPVNTLENVNGGSLFAESGIESESISPELQAFKNFFKTDMRIKSEMIDLAPQPTDSYDEASSMDYAEKAYRAFRDMKHDFLSISRDFGFGKYAEEATADFFRHGEESFALSNYDSRAIQDLYRKAFTDMRPEFIEEVKGEFVGYRIFGGNLGKIVKDASTVNELLHAYHSSIINDEKILRRIPVLASKENSSEHCLIQLRGDHSPLGQQVFDAIPDDLDIGPTDIISVDDHLMMMVRDRGHALTISGEPDEQDPSKIWINYNIPKICNEEMIKSLPGLSGYTKAGARGSFVTSRDELGSSLVDFISKVPMDKDIPEIREILARQAQSASEPNLDS